MGRKMDDGPRRSRGGEKSQETPGAKAKSHRRSESQEPDAIEAEMDPIAMQKCVAHKCPDVRRNPPWISALDKRRRLIAGGNKGKPQQHLKIGVRREYEFPDAMDERQRQKNNGDDRRDVEDRFGFALQMNGPSPALNH